MRHFLTPLILILVLAAVGSWYWFKEKEKPAGLQDAEASVTIWKVEQDDIAAVEIVQSDRKIKLVRDKKDKKNWKLAAPFKAKAGDSEVDSLLWSVAEIKSDYKSPLDAKAKSDLGQFGLDAPRIALTLTLKNGETKKLFVGAENPISSLGSYARTADGDALYILDASKVSGLEKQPGDLRDKTFMTFDRDDVTAVGVIEKDAGEILCEKKEIVKEKKKDKDKSKKDSKKDKEEKTGPEKETRWVFRSNPARECEDEAQGVMSSLEFLRIKDFREGDPLSDEEAGLEPYQTRLTLKMSKGAVLNVDLGNRIEDGGAAAKKPSDGHTVVVFDTILDRAEDLKKALLKIESKDADSKGEMPDLEAIHGMPMGGQ